jgi:uncharacterized protein involved in exopolysaccharide biosynthesis
MELLKVYAALLRRKWIFLQAVVFFTIGATVLALVLPKRYEATAKISVESSSVESSILGEMDLGEMAQSLSGSSDDMQTLISLAQMRPVLDEVIWRLQLRDTDGELLPAEKLLVPGIDGEILGMPFVEITERRAPTSCSSPERPTRRSSPRSSRTRWWPSTSTCRWNARSRTPATH